MEIKLQKRLPENDQLVFDSFYIHKVKELNAEAWSDETKLQLCKMQFQAFERSIHANYTNLEDLIITLGSIPIGRFVLNRSPEAINLIYISVLPEYRKKGIASQILSQMITESNKYRNPLLFSVAKDNRSFGLYLKLGFEVIGEDELIYSMAYNPSPNR